MSNRFERKNRTGLKHHFGEPISKILNQQKFSSITILNDWKRTGAETYSTDFLVHFPDGTKTHFIAKACVKIFPTQVMREWIKRRLLLERVGVKFPRLIGYSADDAILVEEFITKKFVDAYHQSNKKTRQRLKREYIETVNKILGAGFKPVGYLADMRSRGTDAVMLDVGEDLGSADQLSVFNLSTSTTAEDWFQELISIKPSNAR